MYNAHTIFDNRRFRPNPGDFSFGTIFSAKNHFKILFDFFKEIRRGDLLETSYDLSRSKGPTDQSCLFENL
jgi:hypothetical protein